ncbi:hypothetical protein [Pelomonas sp. SE-A7]|uniref:hypothetical protein n=1 Tax=Pelomonas sp. SE-A7 TaxID=3054953 RepID=UPI00259D1472|nr:hypothetical protein [Pelomonas sp. SE-A7]MDM4767281.1 hypothetical protein [Pelomonas sp. SE-A7]
MNINKKQVGLSLAKGVVGAAMIVGAFQRPGVFFGVLIVVFLALSAANFMFNQTHYVVWRNFKPTLVSYQRRDRVDRFKIPKESLLGQAISLVLQCLGYGLVLMLVLGGVMFAIGAIVAAIAGK